MESLDLPWTEKYRPISLKDVIGQTDTGPEWRAFDSDQRNSRSRTGAPMKYTRPNKGLVTEIDLYNKDIRENRGGSKVDTSDLSF